MESTITTLSPEQFTNLCVARWGKWGWQGKVAEILGCSQSHVSNIKTGRVLLKRELQVKLLRHLEHISADQTIESIARATEEVLGVSKETDEEIEKRLCARQRNYEELVSAVFQNNVPSLIVSGPPGTGKSYTVKLKAEQRDVDVDLRTSTISPPGLYKAFYANKDGGIVVFDDCDEAFANEESMNILKAALDSTEKRVLCWSKNAPWLENEDIPDRFEFNGSAIFLTNQDMIRQAARGNKMSKHFEALISRCIYLDLGMHSAREIMIRIKQIAPELLQSKGFKKKEIEEILDFMEENKERFFLFSLRELHKISQLYRTGSNWRNLAEMQFSKRV